MPFKLFNENHKSYCPQLETVYDRTPMKGPPFAVPASS